MANVGPTWGLANHDPPPPVLRPSVSHTTPCEFHLPNVTFIQLILAIGLIKKIVPSNAIRLEGHCKLLA